MQTITRTAKSNLKEFKKAIQRDLMLRRYQMWTQGRIPVEDKILDFFAKVNTRTVASLRIFLKRALDITLSLAALIMLSPLMLLIAIAIKLNSSGPVFYKQIRVGKKEKPFDMLKFRTMIQEAEAATGPVWAKENDPRITSVGKFLRKTHLDELPQVINVLKGEMSIVGPRPERPFFVNEFRQSIPHYHRRLCAKPGITGLAQIKRRYDESLADVKKKLRYDVLYIQKMCPLLDLKVIAMTIGAVILRTGR